MLGGLAGAHTPGVIVRAVIALLALLPTVVASLLLRH
jgi:hypothetical protein